ncbi:MAG: 3-oxoacyl-[acyl-carrier-protein] reductase [Phycisphaeraceae bacterium]|nr:3-oxoacyl-[acyl-carrier-protein] reductase [Phycisphaeraceae bacterium]
MALSSVQRVALVTGASRGIGAETARLLAKQGRHVVVMGRNAKSLEEVCGEIRGDGGSASYKTCDVSDGAALNDAIEQIAEEFKRLDILINNAGMTKDGLILRMTDEQFDQVIAVNLRSAFVACRAALRPMMRGKWGRIVNIGSVAGLVGNFGQANYAAAKAGLLGLTKSIAKEMASKNITANLVAPGFTDTEMTCHLPQQVKDYAIRVTPLGRFGQPKEIAAAVAFLASDEAGFITGQALAADGGMTMC